MAQELYKRISPHLQRVLVDGGTTTSNMNELLLLQRSNEQYKDYLKLAFCPELYGNKIRTSGINNYITKGYSLLSNDLTQTASANQPYLDKIAPVEKLSAKNPNNGSNYLTHPTISFNATDEWTVETVLNWNGTNNVASAEELYGLISKGAFRLQRDGNFRFVFISDNLSSNYLFTTYSTLKIIGKYNILTITAKSNVLNVYVNGILCDSASSINTNININAILSGRDYTYTKCNLSSHHIFSKALSASEVAERSAILRSIFPEIPFTRIGEQIWSVRNFEAVVTPQGNLIPEVQSNTTWATSQTLYDNAFNATSGTVEQKTYAGVKAAAMWCHYNNDVNLGATYGKLYNWFAVKLLQMDIDYYNAANPTTPWGWRVPTQADFNTLATALGGTSVAGGKMKMQGTTYWNSPNTGADNSSGFSSIPALVRIPSGSFGNGLNSNYLWHIIGGFVELNNNTSVLSVYGSVDLKYGLSLRLIKVNTDNLYDSLSSLLTDSTGDTLFVNI